MQYEFERFFAECPVDTKLAVAIVPHSIWPKNAKWRDDDGRELIAANHYGDDKLAEYTEGRYPPNFPMPAKRSTTP